MAILTTIPVDLSAFPAALYAGVRPAMEFDNPDIQARDDSGRLLWDVDLLVTVMTWGREAREVIAVRTAVDGDPTAIPMGAVELDGLRVRHSVTQRGALSQRWSADILRAPKGGGGGGSTRREAAS